MSADEKLVRDCYEWLPHRVAGYGEKYGLLSAKFDEEVAEVRGAAIGSPDFVEELADLVEVCYALGGYNTVEQMRMDKRARRGGFDKLLVMKLADITDQPALSTEDAKQRNQPEPLPAGFEVRDAFTTEDATRPTGDKA